jgi:hypothetical protein
MARTQQTLLIIEGESIMKFKCRKCGEQEDTGGYGENTGAELQESKLCFTCNFWEEKVLWKILGGKLSTSRGTGTVVRHAGTHYLAYPMATGKDARGFLGHGGGLFVFEMLDGTIVKSNNVWCQGPIPENYKGLLPDNTKRILPYDEMVALGFVKQSCVF